jgi:hypothetical protein
MLTDVPYYLSALHSHMSILHANDIQISVSKVAHFKVRLVDKTKKMMQGEAKKYDVESTTEVMSLNFSSKKWNLATNAAIPLAEMSLLNHFCLGQPSMTICLPYDASKVTEGGVPELRGLRRERHLACNEFFDHNFLDFF